MRILKCKLHSLLHSSQLTSDSSATTPVQNHLYQQQQLIAELLHTLPVQLRAYILEADPVTLALASVGVLAGIFVMCLPWLKKKKRTTNSPTDKEVSEASVIFTNKDIPLIDQSPKKTPVKTDQVPVKEIPAKEPAFEIETSSSLDRFKGYDVYDSKLHNSSDNKNYNSQKFEPISKVKVQDRFKGYDIDDSKLHTTSTVELKSISIASPSPVRAEVKAKEEPKEIPVASVDLFKGYSDVFDSKVYSGQAVSPSKLSHDETPIISGFRGATFQKSEPPRKDMGRFIEETGVKAKEVASSDLFKGNNDVFDSRLHCKEMGRFIDETVTGIAVISKNNAKTETKQKVTSAVSSSFQAEVKTKEVPKEIPAEEPTVIKANGFDETATAQVAAVTKPKKEASSVDLFKGNDVYDSKLHTTSTIPEPKSISVASNSPIKTEIKAKEEPTDSVDLFKGYSDVFGSRLDSSVVETKSKVHVTQDSKPSTLQQSQMNVLEQSQVNVTEELKTNVRELSQVNVTEESEMNVTEQSKVNFRQLSQVSVLEQSEMNVTEELKTNVRELSQVNVTEELQTDVTALPQENVTKQSQVSVTVGKPKKKITESLVQLISEEDELKKTAEPELHNLELSLINFTNAKSKFIMTEESKDTLTHKYQQQKKIENTETSHLRLEHLTEKQKDHFIHNYMETESETEQAPEPVIMRRPPKPPVSFPPVKVAVNESIKHLIEMVTPEQEKHELEKPRMKLIKIPESMDQAPYLSPDNAQHDLHRLSPTSYLEEPRVSIEAAARPVVEPEFHVERKVLEDRAPVSLSAASSMYQQCLHNYARVKETRQFMDKEKDQARSGPATTIRPYDLVTVQYSRSTIANRAPALKAPAPVKATSPWPDPAKNKNEYKRRSYF